jgi:putative hydrolase of the HAD superfamily
MPIPAFLVLDLDDTILDFSATGEAVWKRLFREFAPRMGMPVEKLQQAIDTSRKWYWSAPDRFREGRLDLKKARRLILHDAFGTLRRTDWETADELADTFTRDREAAVQPLNGAIDTLAFFQRSGSRMVLLTNGESSVQRAKIERFRLAGFFQSILIEGETGFGKPDPRAHRAALSSLGVEPPSAWMIGDDWDCDIAPARSLGMRAAWIHEESRSADGTADLTVHSLRVLADCWKQSG